MRVLVYSHIVCVRSLSRASNRAAAQLCGLARCTARQLHRSQKSSSRSHVARPSLFAFVRATYTRARACFKCSTLPTNFVAILFKTMRSHAYPGTGISSPLGIIVVITRLNFALALVCVCVSSLYALPFTHSGTPHATCGLIVLHARLALFGAFSSIVRLPLRAPLAWLAVPHAASASFCHFFFQFQR